VSSAGIRISESAGATAGHRATDLQDKSLETYIFSSFLGDFGRPQEVFMISCEERLPAQTESPFQLDLFIVTHVCVSVMVL
jgi:hypothetical protein